MKKRFSLINLDCADCAAKMESAIRKIDGVKDVSVSFLTQRLSLEAEDARFDEILRQAESACRKVDPNCTIKR